MIGNQVAQTRQNQVEEQLDRLQATVEQNAKLSQEIPNRFAAVIRNEATCGQQCDKGPEETLVPVADRIRNIIRQIEANNGVLISAMQRAEV